jgi:hypothetical protein
MQLSHVPLPPFPVLIFYHILPEYSRGFGFFPGFRRLPIILVDAQWSIADGIDEAGFANAVDMALSIEKRFDADMFTSDDLRRYDLAVRAIGRHAKKTGRRFGTIGVSSMEQLASYARPTEATPTRSFFPPSSIPSYKKTLLKAIEENRCFNKDISVLADAFTCAENHNCGVVIALTQDIGAKEFFDSSGIGGVSAVEAKPEPAAAQALSERFETVPDCFSDDHVRRKSFSKLQKELVWALRNGLPICVGASARHEILAEMLSELHRLGVTGQLRIMYVDGSESEPFQFYGAAAIDGVSASLKYGLMSMRHTELDEDVDGYIFRNRMISLQRTLAETEKDCAVQTTQFIANLTSCGINGIELIHTGFEPAVIGFYRAVSRWNSIQTSEAFFVQPIYITRNGYVKGTVWG